jgi:hypothetical protein
VNVAFVPYVPPQPLSPRAQELGQRVQLTIAEFQQKYPDLSDEEIRQALMSAVSATEPGTDRAPAALGAIAAAVAVVAGLGVWLFARGGGATGTARPFVLAIAVVAAVVGLMAARRRRE